MKSFFTAPCFQGSSNKHFHHFKMSSMTDKEREEYREITKQKIVRMNTMKHARSLPFQDTFYTLCSKCKERLDPMVALNRKFCNKCYERCLSCSNIFEKFYMRSITSDISKDNAGKSVCKYCLYLWFDKDEEDELLTLKEPEE